MSQVSQVMAEHLNKCGLVAVTAWNKGSRMNHTQAVVAVSLRSCESVSGGFQDYLGERYNEVSGLWEELYGRRAKVKLGLDLYATAEVGEDGIQTAFDAMTQVFAEGEPTGLVVQELKCAETEYDTAGKRFKRKVEGDCLVYLYAVAEAGGTFLDFEIRGGLGL